MNFSKISLVFGIMSLVICCLNLPLGLCGVILALIALFSREGDRGYAVAGLVTSGVGLLFGLFLLASLILSWVLPTVSIFSLFHSASEQFYDDSEDYDWYNEDYGEEDGTSDSSGISPVLYGVGDMASLGDLNVTLKEVRQVPSENGETVEIQADFLLVTTGDIISPVTQGMPVFYGYYDLNQDHDTIVKINSDNMQVRELPITVKFTQEAGRTVRIGVYPQDYVSDTVYFVADESK